MRLQDKVCIITGAGSGMGRVATQMFCEQGARVVADVVQAAGEETVALARQAGPGKAEDIVYLAIYLTSDESTWTNGPTLVVDGGSTSNYFKKEEPCWYTRLRNAKAPSYDGSRG